MDEGISQNGTAGMGDTETRGERGFALIELLIVLTILGILVGVAALGVDALNVTAMKGAMDAESRTIQAAMDTWLTQDVMVEGSSIVSTSITTGLQLGPDVTSQGFEDYLKRTTKYYFTWTDLSATSTYTLTVQDAATSATFSFDGSTWVEP